MKIVSIYYFQVSPKIETARFASYPDVTLSSNELQEKKR